MAHRVDLKTTCGGTDWLSVLQFLDHCTFQCQFFAHLAHAAPEMKEASGNPARVFLRGHVMAQLALTACSPFTVGHPPPGQ